MFLQWSKDLHLPEFPTIVHISSEHNHNINIADAMQDKDVGKEAMEKLTKLSEEGDSPSSALDVLMYDFQVQHGDNYLHASAAGAICLDLQLCYRYLSYVFIVI